MSEYFYHDKFLRELKELCAKHKAFLAAVFKGDCEPRIEVYIPGEGTKEYTSINPHQPHPPNPPSLLADLDDKGSITLLIQDVHTSKETHSLLARLPRHLSTAILNHARALEVEDEEDHPPFNAIIRRVNAIVRRDGSQDFRRYTVEFEVPPEVTKAHTQELDLEVPKPPRKGKPIETSE